MSHPQLAPVTIVLCTAPVAAAADLARRLVDERLAACANLVGPLRSVFRWQGAVDEAEEHLLVLKTTRPGELRDRIVELHGYDVPEVLEVPVLGGLPSYLEWVAASCSTAGDAGA